MQVSIDKKKYPNLSPYGIKEIHSSKFKRQYKNLANSSNTPNSEKKEKKSSDSKLLKKTTFNISEFRSSGSYEEQFSKNFEMCTSFLKSFPIVEVGSVKERHQNFNNNQSQFTTVRLHTQFETAKIRSIDNLPYALSQSSTENIFKSPQLSPVLDGKTKRGSIISPTTLNKYLHNSLSLRPLKNNLAEETHSALGHSVFGQSQQIKEVEEASENSIDKSLGEIKSEGLEEEVKEQDILPDDVNFMNNAGNMEKSWDYKSINKNEPFQKDDITQNQIIVDETKEFLKPSRFLLLFGNQNQEAVEKFHENMFISKKKTNYFIIILVFMILIYHFLCERLRQNFKSISLTCISKLSLLLMIIGILKYFIPLFEKRLLKKFLILIYLIVLIAMLWSNIFEGKKINLNELTEIILIEIFFQNLSIFMFIDAIILSLILALFLIFFKIASLFQIGIIIFVFLIHLFWMRRNLLNEISKNNLNIASSIKKKQQKTLIRHLLPNHITQQFINKPSSKADLIEEFEDVTILFADIKGFTDFSANNPPHVVVNMLRDLFTEFDKLCLQNDVYKLYTIGDCYVALGLIDATERNVEEEARNVIQFAFDMLNAIKSIRKKNPELEMRIGIHIVIYFFNFLQL